MKRFLRVLAFSIIINQLSIINSNAQWVSIPDTNFGTWLNTNGYAACIQGSNGVGWQMDTSCPAVVNDTFMNCSNQNIKDLTGVQYFKHLTQLTCNNNNLITLPSLSDSIWWLLCYYNRLQNLPRL